MLPNPRRLHLHGLAAVFALLSACVSHEQDGAIPSPRPAKPVDSAESATSDATLETPHFIVKWHSGAASLTEANIVRDRAEGALTRYGTILGADKLPKEHITIRLRGEAGPNDIPTVDPQTGEILLFKYPGPSGGYEASLAH